MNQKKQGWVRWKWALGLAAALAGLAWGVLAFRSAGDWISPKIGPVYDSIYGVGTVRSDRLYKLRMGVQSKLSQILVAEGQWVAKGRPLARFSEGNLALAPFEGQVSEINFYDGEMVFPNLPVLTLTDTRARFIELDLVQSGAIRIRPGQEARVSFEDLSKEPLLGRVATLYPGRGQFLARVELPSLPEGALVNMTADVAVVIARREQALQVPVAALSGGMLRVRRQGRELALKPALGASDGTWVELGGAQLAPGDLVFLPRAKKSP